MLSSMKRGAPPDSEKAQPTVVGIDVGGERKGFHAVALRNGLFQKTTSTDPATIVAWCLELNAGIVAVDAPCAWSQWGVSRLCERALEVEGTRIHCFGTPTRPNALAHEKGFYDWVFNGERLYQHLMHHYPLFNGKRQEQPVCFETFPQAIVCALAQQIIPAKPKASMRRRVLSGLGYDHTPLTNIDFVDAALCAVAADAFSKGDIAPFGEQEEGVIIVPAPRTTVR